MKNINWKEHPEYDNIILSCYEKGMTRNDIKELIPKSTYRSIAHRVERLRELGKIAPYEDLTKKEKEANLDIVKIAKKDMRNFTKELGETVVDVIKDINLKFKNVPLQVKYDKKKQEQDSILDLSDLHIGEVNEVFDSETQKQITTYNYAIYLKQLEVLREAIFRIHALESNAYSLKTLYINFLGDILTNDRIFRGQEFHIDMVVGEQLWKGVYSLFNFVNQMKTIYENIVITGVVGNHGRSSKDPKMDEPVQNNFEYHLYMILQHMFKDDKRITVNVPVTRQHIINISGWKHMLMHGDSLRGSSDIAIRRQVETLFLNTGYFEVLEFGHFHNIAESEIGDKVLVKKNGCWINKESYGFKNFKLYSRPYQWFYGCSKKRKQTWSYKLDLRVGE